MTHLAAKWGPEEQVWANKEPKIRPRQPKLQWWDWSEGVFGTLVTQSWVQCTQVPVKPNIAVIGPTQHRPHFYQMQKPTKF